MATLKQLIDGYYEEKTKVFSERMSNLSIDKKSKDYLEAKERVSEIRVGLQILGERLRIPVTEDESEKYFEKMNNEIDSNLSGNEKRKITKKIKSQENHDIAVIKKLGKKAKRVLGSAAIEKMTNKNNNNVLASSVEEPKKRFMLSRGPIVGKK